MGWETRLYFSHGFNRKTYDNIEQVESDLEEAKSSLQYAKERIARLAYVTEPEKFMSKDDKEEGVSGADWLQFELKEMFEMYEDAFRDVIWLEALQDNWIKCHNEEGLAIPCPGERSWDKAYLDGDFVKTVERPKGLMIDDL